jgi:hypothetical protein
MSKVKNQPFLLFFGFDEEVTERASLAISEQWFCILLFSLFRKPQQTLLRIFTSEEMNSFYPPKF